MFRRRVKILLWAVALAWLVLLARLAQIQIGSHDLFVLDNYTRAGGNRLLETVRGGIYARWGTPLAVQAPSFDIAVHYRQLLPACSEPWRLQEVRELIDEYEPTILWNDIGYATWSCADPGLQYDTTIN